MTFAKLVLIVCLVGAACMLVADDDSTIENELTALSAAASSAYLNPIVSAYGSNFNTGWFKRSPQARVLGLDIAFDIVLMGAFFGDDDRTFRTDGAFHLNEEQAELILMTIDWDQYGPYGDVFRQDLLDQLLSKDYRVSIHGPTVVGSENETIYITFHEQDFTVGQDVNEQTITVDRIDINTGATAILSDAPGLPYAAPQITIGSYRGTSLVLRFLPKQSNEDIGDITCFGFGIQHNPAMWLGPLLKHAIPVDLCLQFCAQEIKFGDLVRSSSWNLMVGASKTFKLGWFEFTPFGGLMVEGSNLEFEYTFAYDVPDEENPGEIVQETRRIKYSIESENKGRMLLGLSSRLGVFESSMDFNLAKMNSMSWSFGLGYTF